MENEIPGYVWVAIAAGAIWYAMKSQKAAQQPAQQPVQFPQPYITTQASYDPSQYLNPNPAFADPGTGYGGGAGGGYYPDPSTYAPPSPSGQGPPQPSMPATPSVPSTVTNLSSAPPSVPNSVLPPSMQPGGQTGTQTTQATQTTQTPMMTKPSKIPYGATSMRPIAMPNGGTFLLPVHHMSDGFQVTVPGGSGPGPGPGPVSQAVNTLNQLHAPSGLSQAKQAALSMFKNAAPGDVIDVSE